MPLKFIFKFINKYGISFLHITLDAHAYYLSDTNESNVSDELVSTIHNIQ